MRRFLLAAILFSLIGMTAAVADDPLVQVAPAQPKVIPSGLPTSPITTAATLEEELETLEAQRETKKGYLKAAEIGVKAAEMNAQRLDRIAGDGDVSKEDVEQAKKKVEGAKVQFEARTSELKEVEVKIKYAGKRLEEAKAVANRKPTAEELKALVTAMAAGWFGGTPLRSGAALHLPSAAPSTSEQKIAAFNMAAVMKEYGKANYQVYLLNEEKKKMSADLVALQAKYLKNQQDIQNQQDAGLKEQIQERQVELTRQIEDKNHIINKKMNEKATKIISSLYDEIKEEVDKMAEQNGYDIVFAYPDARSPEELKSAYVKELKLKPPAAQPFFLTKSVDLTDAVIKGLNTRNPAPPVPEGAQSPPMPIPMK
ncbi:MAG TPA: OmpH family outer membrane protein [Gemmata sp.]|jgi:Skp family chaperone for outer membrane proteins|nr:OmpH family outer membrane protein [Gemmata sp.]